MKVRRFLKKDTIDIELINAKDEFHKKDLTQNSGILKVPCLKVSLKKNQVEWIYESNKIIDFISKEIKIIKS